MQVLAFWFFTVGTVLIWFYWFYVLGGFDSFLFCVESLEIDWYLCLKWFQYVISTSSFVYVTGWRFEDFYNFLWPSASHCYNSFVCFLLLCFSLYCNIAVALSYNSFCLNKNLQNQFLFSLLSHGYIWYIKWYNVLLFWKCKGLEYDEWGSIGCLHIVLILHNSLLSTAWSLSFLTSSYL